MTSYVETLSLTELIHRKSFLENQLNIVNDLINEKNIINEKDSIIDNSNNSSEISELFINNIDSINNFPKKKIRIKIKIKN
jgi:hypothetical protein